LPSGIGLLLQRTVDLLDGLQFVVFVPDRRLGEAFSDAWPHAANLRAIEALIRLHGLEALGHTAERQVEIWQQSVAPVANFFSKLWSLEPLEADGAPSSLTRVVLDAEVGGLFYGTVGSYGWLFAATLDQQPLNTGLAEQHFAAAVKHIAGALDETKGSKVRKAAHD
jgi:hypothetical protein